MIHNEKEIIKIALSKLASENTERLSSHIRQAINDNADNAELARNLRFADIDLNEYIKSLCILVVEGKF